VQRFEHKFKRLKQTDYRMMEGRENEQGNDEVDISETPPKKNRRQHSQKYLAEYESLFPYFRKSGRVTLIAQFVEFIFLYHMAVSAI
jgi:hypothetical protein